MGFQDLEEFFHSDLRLPVRGKTYVIESPDAITGLNIQKLFQILAKAKSGEQVDEDALAALDLDDDQEKDLYQRLLGSAYDEMLAEMSWEQLKFCAITTLIWVAGGVESAEVYWSSGGIPEAPAPNRAARRAGRGSGSRTRKPGSPAGTTSPKVIEGHVTDISNGIAS